MILDTLAESSRRRVAGAKSKVSLDMLKAQIYDKDTVKCFHGRENFAFEKALKGKGISFICEVKKASPSKGIIAPDFPYLDIAGDYETAGAAAISVLTEPEYFKGSNTFLSEISKEVKIPVLRKDFTVDEYQIYEAKAIGADAILLICALLDSDSIHRYLQICSRLGLSALVEAHNKEEVSSAVRAGAKIIGVNNRDLRTFQVDIRTCIKLREYVPEDITFVAESGIKTAEDILSLTAAGVDAVLIGETLMRSENRKEMLAYFASGGAVPGSVNRESLNACGSNMEEKGQYVQN